MTSEPQSPQEKEFAFFQTIVAEYLKYGSVDEVFKVHEYCLPISYMGFHRILDKWGIVKAAGPNSKLSEAICFLTTLSQKKIPLEKLYKSMPPSFKVSMSTLHRILHCVKEGVVRRVGTALVITLEDKPDMVLVASDVSTPRVELGKPFGSVSLPMGYSKEGEEPTDAIARILQQEVFTQEAIGQRMVGVIADNPTPIAYVDIADVRVAVFPITLPAEFSQVEKFSSFKLEDFRFIHISELIRGSENFRSGISEIGAMYQKYLTGAAEEEVPFFATSLLNQQLVDFAQALV